MTSASGPFVSAALPANRSGRLTDEQARGWQQVARANRKSVRGAAWVPAAIGLLLLFANGPAAKQTQGVAFGLAALAIACVMLIAPGQYALRADVRESRVDVVEGAIGKHVERSYGRSMVPARHFIDIAGRALRTPRDWYKAAPDAGIVRAYYLPRTRRLVNLEVLPDRPLPSGPDVPQQIIRQTAAALFSGDAAARAEASATAAAFMHAVTGPEPDASAPGANARVTADALYGTWTNPMMTVTFARDGVATLAPVIGGRTYSGRWSVDAAGRLLIDAGGESQPADASLVDGRLTISLDGRRVMFTRAAR